MATRRVQRAAAAVLVLAAALAGGCSNDEEPVPAQLAGTWSGSLNVSYAGGGGAGGGLTMTLGQDDGFVSGIAAWSPVTGGMSVAGPVDANVLTLYLHFSCEGKPEETAVTGTFDGARIAFSGASGWACPDGGGARAVVGASGSVGRTTDSVPL